MGPACQWEGGRVVGWTAGGREGVSVRWGWPDGPTQGGGRVTGRAGEKEEGGEWAGVGQKGEEAHVAFLPFSLGF